MAGTVIKGYHVLLTGAKTISADEKEKRKDKEISELKVLNFTVYNDLILAQDDTVCFHIIEEAKTEANKCRDARLEWAKISKN